MAAHLNENRKVPISQLIEKTAARRRTGALLANGCGILFECVRHRRERGGQVCSDALHSGDNHERNACRDQSVFDRGRACLIASEPLDNCLH